MASKLGKLGYWLAIGMSFTVSVAGASPAWALMGGMSPGTGPAMGHAGGMSSPHEERGI